MGAKVTVTVINQTPCTWQFATQSNGFIHVDAGCSKSYKETYYGNCNIRFKRENHTTESFKYEFDTTNQIYWYNVTFIIRETPDHSQIELHCTNDNGTRVCPNYKNTEDENQKQNL